MLWESCDASAPPTNGGVGDCPSSLPSGSTCQPTCNAGYTVSGTSSCYVGTLTAATCSISPCDASTPHERRRGRLRWHPNKRVDVSANVRCWVYGIRVVVVQHGTLTAATCSPTIWGNQYVSPTRARHVLRIDKSRGTMLLALTPLVRVQSICMCLQRMFGLLCRTHEGRVIRARC